jgi:hypothetical protein
VVVGAAFEAPAVVSSFDDIAVVSEAIEQRGCHLSVREDARPFAGGEIGGDDDRGALVEPADEVELELSAGLGVRRRPVTLRSPTLVAPVRGSRDRGCAG